jgi:bifunctional isochorismate lyase/aryl carrier protein
LTLDQMRADIAEVLEESPDAIAPGENLVDLGLDSIRIMTLAERWSRPGARVEFVDLIEITELHHWFDVVSRRHATLAG